MYKITFQDSYWWCYGTGKTKAFQVIRNAHVLLPAPSALAWTPLSQKEMSVQKSWTTYSVPSPIRRDTMLSVADTGSREHPPQPGLSFWFLLGSSIAINRSVEWTTSHRLCLPHTVKYGFVSCWLYITSRNKTCMPLEKRGQLNWYVNPHEMHVTMLLFCCSVKRHSLKAESPSSSSTGPAAFMCTSNSSSVIL